MTRTRDSQQQQKKEKKKKNLLNCGFNFPSGPQSKTEESEKKDKYLDLAWELVKLRNMKVTIIPFVICDLGTVTKGLVQGLADLEIKGGVETIQATALLRSAIILKRVMKRLTATETPERNHRLTLVWKNRKGVIIIRNRIASVGYVGAGGRDETVYHLISRRSKLVEKKYC